MFKFKQYNWKHYNVTLIMAVLLLSAVGAWCIRMSDGDYMFKRQIMGVLMGIAVIGIVSIIDYHFICKFVILYYLAGVAMLFMVKFTSFGVDHTTGAFRWIDIGFIEIQPSELVKIIMILCMAVFLSKVQEKLDKWYVFLISAVIMAIPTFLILIQTDLSSSLVMVFIYVIMIFAAGLSFKIIIPIVALGIPMAVVLFWYVQQPYQRLLTSVQQGRIISYLNPAKYASSGMFQQNNSVQAIASGQVYGKFLMGSASDYRRYMKVYVNESDFIFSVVGEEFGFLGACIIITLFMFIIIKCVITAKNAKDFTGKMIALGVSAMLMFQVFANIGVATSILPNTGLPLPFLSYGLSSLISSMIAVGLVINIGLQKTRSRG